MSTLQSLFSAAGVVSIVLSVATPAHGQFEPVRERIQRVLVEENIPSFAVAVARDGEIIWEEGFGWADRERRLPATAHIMYSLASISKPITATGLMVLIERGQIDLEAPINAYLGDAKLRARVGSANHATVLRVANHTSGLPLHYQFFYEDEPYQRPPMDETIRRYGNLVTAPGERWQYSNLGYGVVDYVISRVSQTSFPEFMRQEVFVPLGMTRSSVHIGPGLAQYAATRYAKDGTPIPFYDFDHPGGSAVFSSAHDLVRFGMFHLKNHLADQAAIISDAAIDRMQGETVESGPQTSYGIGWSVSVVGQGVRTVSHGGGMGGVSTRLTLVPEADLAVVVLSNASSRWPGEITTDILAALLPERIERQAAAASAPTADPAPNNVSRLTGRWEGFVETYVATMPFTLDVRGTDDMHARLGEQPWTLIDSATFDGEYLRGRMMGDIGTNDSNRRSYYLQLEVMLRGDVLNGSVTANSSIFDGAWGGIGTQPRMGNALTHWIALAKQ